MSAETLKAIDADNRLSVPERTLKPHKLVLIGGAIIGVTAVIFGHHLLFSPAAAPPSSSPTAPAMTVTVIRPEKMASMVSLQLPGQLQAYTEAPIYAQTSGYLQAWYFDIGAKVKANDILGQIDTPEVDQELAQAKAQLQVAQSALNLSQVTFQRYQDLYDRHVIAVQDRDTAEDTYHENQATVLADEANINRLNALEAFKLIRAPFDGIVTARDTDIGAYVAAGSGTQLFRVARTSPLRIYINVPQEYAELVKVGAQGDLTLPEFPGRSFPAQVTNTGGAVDPVSRSLLVELQIPNETNELLPGAYAVVNLKLTGTSNILTVPANTLLFRREGPAVGVVGADGKVEIAPITINGNQGDRLEISKGLSGSEQVILDPSDGLTSGMVVNINAANTAAHKPDASTSK